MSEEESRAKEEHVLEREVIYRASVTAARAAAA